MSDNKTTCGVCGGYFDNPIADCAYLAGGAFACRRQALPRQAPRQVPPVPVHPPLCPCAGCEHKRHAQQRP